MSVAYLIEPIRQIKQSLERIAKALESDKHGTTYNIYVNVGPDVDPEAVAKRVVTTLARAHDRKRPTG